MYKPSIKYEVSQFFLLIEKGLHQILLTRQKKR